MEKYSYKININYRNKDVRIYKTDFSKLTQHKITPIMGPDGVLTALIAHDLTAEELRQVKVVIKNILDALDNLIRALEPGTVVFNAPPMVRWQKIITDGKKAIRYRKPAQPKGTNTEAKEELKKLEEELKAYNIDRQTQ